MPIWVVVEAWSISLASRYFGLLNGRIQRTIANRLDINNPKVLESWLRGISDLRNRCAHHSRIWNYASKNTLPMLKNDPFMDHWISDKTAMERLYGVAVVIARLMKIAGPNSNWFKEFGSIINDKPELPGCEYSGLGLAEATGFPHHLFN